MIVLYRCKGRKQFSRERTCRDLTGYCCKVQSLLAAGLPISASACCVKRAAGHDHKHEASHCQLHMTVMVASVGSIGRLWSSAVSSIYDGNLKQFPFTASNISAQGITTNLQVQKQDPNGTKFK